MDRLCRRLAAWSLILLGLLLVLVPWIHPDFENSRLPLLLGLAMIVAGAMVIVVGRRGSAEPVLAAMVGKGERLAAAEKSSESMTMHWAGNAPATWPSLETTVDVPSSPSPILALRVAAAFKDGFRAAPSSLQLAGLVPTYLLPNGVLEAALEVAEDGRKIPVFLYPRADDAAAAHFAGVRRALAERSIEPVYFAPQPLAESNTQVEVTSPLGFDRFELRQGEPASGDYSMWWPTAEDANWRAAPGMADIERFYRALDGREPWFLGSLLHQMGTLEETRPALLPDQLDVFSGLGPEGVTVLFSVSAEKGLRLHFHESTSPRARDLIWHHLATYCEQLREVLDKKGAAEVVGSGSHRPLEWWLQMRHTLNRLEGEEGRSIDRVGTIPI